MMNHDQEDPEYDASTELYEEDILEMSDADYLEMIDQEIESYHLNMENPSDRRVLSNYCRQVGLRLFHKYYYLTRDTTPYLNLWKWWASNHKISTHNFDYCWDHKFL
jgi:hypothetical protein